MNSDSSIQNIEITTASVLLVDDEENILSSLKRLLRKDGYRIFTANSGAAGLEVLRREAVDVIISDQRMPGMTGTEFLIKARELSANSVRLVLSGYTELASVTEAINEGAVYKFLTKPWDDDLLRLAVRESLRHKWVEDENRMLRSMLLEVNEELAESNGKLQEQVQFARNALQRQQYILYDLPIPIVGLGDKGQVSLINAAAKAVFGISLASTDCENVAMLPPEIRRLLEPDSTDCCALTLSGKAYVAHKRRAPSDQAGYVIALVPG